MILPSFLEYSAESLEQKIDKILVNYDKFQKIVNLEKKSQNVEITEKIENLELAENSFEKNSGEILGKDDKKVKKTWSLHLDFVLEQFAKDRFVMKSLGLDSVFSIFEKKMRNQKLNLTVHLMGENEDWQDAFNFWQQFKIPQNWQIQLFVPSKMTKLFTFEKPNLATFQWLDLGDWEDAKELENEIENLDETLGNPKKTPKKFLLMTVKAGLSGQIMTVETKNKAVEMVKNNPKVDFILDGGWRVQDQQIFSNFQNVNLVSYSSFWKNI
jgi:hypothetical protein